MVWPRNCSSVISRPLRWARARAKAWRVGRPWMRSAKWLASLSARVKARRVAACVVQPIRAMKTGTSGSVNATIRALGQSASSSTPPTRKGTLAARPSCGRYLEK